jgi:hypothetical protein
MTSHRAEASRGLPVRLPALGFSSPRPASRVSLVAPPSFFLVLVVVEALELASSASSIGCRPRARSSRDDRRGLRSNARTAGGVGGRRCCRARVPARSYRACPRRRKQVVIRGSGSLREDRKTRQGSGRVQAMGASCNCCKSRMMLPSGSAACRVPARAQPPVLGPMLLCLPVPPGRAPPPPELPAHLQARNSDMILSAAFRPRPHPQRHRHRMRHAAGAARRRRRRRAARAARLDK